MIRRLSIVSVLLVIVIAALIAINTWRHSSQQITVRPAIPVPVDSPAVSARLAEAIRFRTISFENPSAETQAQLLGFRAYLERTFPHLHAALRREVVNGYSLLFTWPGADQAAKPILLMAHQDVVPVAPATEKDSHAHP